MGFIKTYKVMLHPNNKQQTRLFQYAGTSRFAYNWALEREMKAFKDGDGLISEGDLRKDFTILRNSQEYSWLKTISNNVTKQAIRDLHRAYRNFFAKQKRTNVKFTKKTLTRLSRQGKAPTTYDMNGHPKFKSKRHGHFSFYQDTAKIKVTATHVKLEGLAGSKRKNRQRLNWIRLAEVGRIPLGVSYTNPRVSFDGLNWWLTIGAEVEVAATPAVDDLTEGIGIDLGIRRLERKARRLQRGLSRQYQHGEEVNSRYLKTRNVIRRERQLLKVLHRLRDIRENYLHQITSALMKRTILN